MDKNNFEDLIKEFDKAAKSSDSPPEESKEPSSQPTGEQPSSAANKQLPEETPLEPVFMQGRSRPKDEPSPPREQFPRQESPQPPQQPQPRQNQSPRQQTTRPKSAAKSPSPKKVKKGGRNKGLVVLLVVLVVVIAGAVMGVIGFMDVIGMGRAEGKVTVQIPQGASTQDIATILEKEGVIENVSMFRLYSKMKKQDGTYQYGDFTIDTSMPYDEIIKVLQTTAQRDDIVNVPVIEGYTLLKIALLLEEKGVCSADDFIKASEEIDFGFDFEKQIPSDPTRFFRLEGYIFPNTHDFYVGEDPESVVKRFLSDFDSKITDEMYARMKQMDMTLDEVLTLASIVQKEAGDKAEMKKVASVFLNRLNNPGMFPQLQSDASYNYIENVIKLYGKKEQNQATYDAYESYTHVGLPVGAICNPGLLAIEAVLYPDDTSYYFFLSDTNGKYYYAETMAQHERNWEIAKSVGVKNGTNVQ